MNTIFHSRAEKNGIVVLMTNYLIINVRESIASTDGSSIRNWMYIVRQTIVPPEYPLKTETALMQMVSSLD